MLPRSLRFCPCHSFFFSLEGVMPPGSLQTLAFGYWLNQSLHGDDAVQPAVGLPADIDL
jgi:hypothetical protein